MGRSLPGERPLDERSRLRILIVDDNPDTAGSLALFLGMDGHDARIVGSGGDAQAMVAGGFVPHLVLVEIWLPDMSGHEALRRLRTLPQTARAMMAAITGYGDVEAREQATSAGCDVHLIRPVDFERLGSLVARAAARA